VRFCCDVISDRQYQTTEQQFFPWIRFHLIVGRNAINADSGRGTTWIICILSRGADGSESRHLIYYFKVGSI
jgi:hypothetical protein